MAHLFRTTLIILLLLSFSCSQKQEKTFDPTQEAEAQTKASFLIHGTDTVLTGVPFLNWGVHRPSWIRARDYAGPYSSKKNVYYKGTAQSANGGGWAPHLRSSLNVQLIRYADQHDLYPLPELQIELSKVGGTPRLQQNPGY